MKRRVKYQMNIESGHVEVNVAPVTCLGGTNEVGGDGMVIIFAIGPPSSEL